MRVPKDRYGCIVVALVYLPFTAEIGERTQE